MAFLFRSYCYSWLWNLQLGTRRLLSSASMQLSKTVTVVPIIRIWPPFREADDVLELQTLLQYIDFYIGPLCPPIEYFTWNIQNAGQTICRHNGDDKKVIDQIDYKHAERLCQAARYRLIWRVGKISRLFLRPFDYLVNEGNLLNATNEWVRLVNNVFQANGFKQPTWFSPPVDQFESCAVLGTGPSSELFRGETDRFNTWIGANSMVLDKELWRKCAPFGICMLDPDLFTPLPYSRELMKSLFCLLKETGSYLLTTAEFAPLLYHLLPKCVQKQCAYVRSFGLNGFILRWSPRHARMLVPRFGNVLCDLMLPIASVISKNIVIYGCDGIPENKTGANFPKSPRFQALDQCILDELKHTQTKTFYKKEIPRIYLHTRYVINRCFRNTGKILLRRHSFNQGLSHLRSLE